MPPTIHTSTAGGQTFRAAHLLAAILILLLLASCGQRQETDSGKYSIELLQPEPSSTTLFVRLSDDTGQPVTDAHVSIEGNMNHAGMVPVISGPVTDKTSPSADGADDGSADGVYRLPFQFTMLGDWIITVTAAVGSDSGNVVSRDFDLSVDANGATLTDP